MPVQPATEVLASKALALSEHSCDLGRLFPHARALREQIDWPALRAQLQHWPYAGRSWTSATTWASRRAPGRRAPHGLDCDVAVALTHYAPIAATLEGEPHLAEGGDGGLLQR
jgi:hypothetical protein